MNTYIKSEQGAASVHIVLEDGEIEIIHGSDGIVLARKEITREGDWDKLWEFLIDTWGAERTEAGASNA